MISSTVVTFLSRCSFCLCFIILTEPVAAKASPSEIPFESPESVNASLNNEDDLSSSEKKDSQDEPDPDTGQNTDKETGDDLINDKSANTDEADDAESDVFDVDKTDSETPSDVKKAAEDVPVEKTVSQKSKQAPTHKKSATPTNEKKETSKKGNHPTNKTVTATDSSDNAKREKSLYVKTVPRRHAIKAGLGIPICSFSTGIIEGMECVNFTSRFSWINASIMYQFRINHRFRIGGGIMPAYVSLAHVQGFGAHFVIEGAIIIAPEWLYAGMQIIGGFPLLAAYTVFIGHEIRLNKKMNLVIENHFTAMAIAGFYSYWQPFVGIKTDF